MKKYVWLLLVLVFVLVALPWVCDREGARMDDAARRALVQGQVVALSRGTTHYELTGSKAGPTVVLIHGTSGPMTVWDRTVPQLVEAGYRVLRYDLFGRGYSDRIESGYGLDLYVEQLEELLRKLESQRDLVLVGSSLGAIIAGEYALRHGGEIRGVVLVGPAGFPLQASPLARLAHVPGMGEYLMSVVGDRQLVAHHRGYFHEPARFEEEHRRFAAQLRYQGSKHAILETLRHAPLQSYLDGYARLGQSGVPVLVIWGDDDRAFPHAHHTELLARIPHAELVTVEAAGHLPQLERPEVAGPALISFVARASGRDASDAAGPAGTR